jgi:hypothetical protein
MVFSVGSVGNEGERNMEKKYRALRFIGSVYKILGIILGVLTIISVLAICVMSVLGGGVLDNMMPKNTQNLGGGIFTGIVGGAILSIVALLYGGVMSVSLIAMGEAIYLLINLEENTRTAALLLQQR